MVPYGWYNSSEKRSKGFGIFVFGKLPKAAKFNGELLGRKSVETQRYTLTYYLQNLHFFHLHIGI